MRKSTANLIRANVPPAQYRAAKRAWSQATPEARREARKWWEGGRAAAVVQQAKAVREQARYETPLGDPEC